MSNETLLASASRFRGTDVPRARRVSRYFLGMSLLLLAIVLIGFAPTFFLRPLFQVPAIPWYVYVHGSVMTAWFVLLVAQTGLVAAGRTDLHRRLGVWGAALAVAVVTVSLLLSLRLPVLVGPGIPASTGGPPITYPGSMQLMWGNLGVILIFSGMVTTAVLMRRRPEVHKRLLLLASINMIGPAAARVLAIIARQSGASASAPEAFFQILVPVVLVVLALGPPLSLVAYDLLTRRRPHPATLWGILAIIVGVVFGNVMPATAAGPALWKALT
jgi:hypothetical protein